MHFKKCFSLWISYFYLTEITLQNIIICVLVFREGFLRIHDKVLCNGVPAICISVGMITITQQFSAHQGKQLLNLSAPYPFFFSFCLSETSTLRIYFSFSLFEFDIISSCPSSFQAADEISCAKFIFMACTLSLMEVREQVKVKKNRRRMRDRKGGRERLCIHDQ